MPLLITIGHSFGSAPFINKRDEPIFGLTFNLPSLTRPKLIYRLAVPPSENIRCGMDIAAHRATCFASCWASFSPLGCGSAGEHRCEHGTKHVPEYSHGGLDAAVVAMVPPSRVYHSAIFPVALSPVLKRPYALRGSGIIRSSERSACA